MTLPNSLSLTKKDSKEISQISSWKFHKAPGTERSQGLWHYCFNQEPNHYVSYSYVQLQWRKKRVKEGKKITQSEKGSQGEMEEERKSKVENGFKAKKGGGITPLSKLPETFKDEGIKLMVPSSVSSRARLVCYGWAHRWKLFYSVILLFYPIIQVVIQIRKETQFAEYALYHAIDSPNSQDLMKQVLSFLFIDKELELDEVSWFTQGNTASK